MDDIVVTLDNKSAQYNNMHVSPSTVAPGAILIARAVSITPFITHLLLKQRMEELRYYLFQQPGLIQL